MDENLAYEFEKTPADKIIDFVKQNILNALLVLIYALFIFKDVMNIEKSGASIIAIIADTFIAWFMGMATSTIMRRKGQVAAMATDGYKNMQKSYNHEIEATDKHIDQLDDFCDKKNAQRLVKVQTAILRGERIKYEDFDTKTKEEVCGKDKAKIKCWNKAIHVKIQLITPENLLSETDARYEKGKKEETLSEHNKKKFLGDATSKILMAIIFGYFTVSVVFGASILWSCIQVAIWLLWGIMSYLQDYFYVKQEYQNKIFRKIKYLKEFNNGKEVKVNGNN